MSEAGREAMPENQFPTIRDVRDRLSELVDKGFGDHPCQVLVVPDSTLQAIARTAGQTPDDKPALMIDLCGDSDRLPVALISAQRLSNRGMNLRTQ